MKIDIYNQEGKKVKTGEIAPEIFDTDIQENLLKEVYTVIAGNIRQGLSSSKTRSERQGSGKKPWKQKGTGRARTGSVRNPIWRKGGVIFGPTEEKNFSRKINKKTRQKALKMALSAKVKSEKLFIIDEYTFTEAKTKHFAHMLKELGVSEKSSACVFHPEEGSFWEMSTNIKKAKNYSVDNINVFDLLNSEYCVLTEASVKSIEEKLS